MKVYKTTVWDGTGGRVDVYAAGTSIPDVRRWTEDPYAPLGWKLARLAPDPVTEAANAPGAVSGMVFTPDGNVRIDPGAPPDVAVAVDHLITLGGVEVGFAGKGYRPSRVRAVRVGDLWVVVPFVSWGHTRLLVRSPTTGRAMGSRSLDRTDISALVVRETGAR